MKKHISLVSMLFLLVSFAVVPQASATVAVTSGPTSLVPDPILAPSSSAPIGLFKFTLAYDAGETLTSVKVKVMQNATTTVSGSDLASVALYKDTGSGTFESASDTLLGTQSTVNLSPTSTTVSAAAATPATGTFFVSLSTGATWSGTAPADSIKVALEADQIMSSAEAVSHSMAMTNSITADTAGPTLDNAIAKNTGGSAAKEAGDSVELHFSESTNKPAITSANVNTVFPLSGGHSWLDSTGALGGASWNAAGTILTLTLSNTSSSTTTLPTVAVGDTVTVAGGVVMDLVSNPASGAKTIVGSFSEALSDGGGSTTKCQNGLINGRLYKLKGVATVYLAAACRLKPFRGAAVFHARGLKFQNIIELDSLTGFTVSDKPVLPEAGALAQGSDATVWLVVHGNMRRGFRSAAKFHGLGYAFGQVLRISDQDLALITPGSPIEEGENHPAGSLIKCGNSATVFEIVGSARFPFSSAEAFLSRGHSWEHIATADCSRIRYILGAPISE